MGSGEAAGSAGNAGSARSVSHDRRGTIGILGDRQLRLKRVSRLRLKNKSLSVSRPRTSLPDERLFMD